MKMTNEELFEMISRFEKDGFTGCIHLAFREGLILDPIVQTISKKLYKVNGVIRNGE